MLYNNFKLFLENQNLKNETMDEFIDELEKYNFIDNIQEIANFLYHNNNFNDAINDNIDNIKRYIKDKQNIRNDIKNNFNNILNIGEIVNSYFDYSLKLTEAQKRIQNITKNTMYNISKIIWLYYTDETIGVQDSINYFLDLDKKMNSNFSFIVNKLLFTENHKECLISSIYNAIVSKIEANKKQAINYLNNRNYKIEDPNDIKKLSEKFLEIILHPVKKYFVPNITNKYFKLHVYNVFIRIMQPSSILDIDIEKILEMCLYPDNYEVDWRPNETTPEDYYAL